MPINFDLSLIKRKYGCHIYLETGLYCPHDDISCKKALNCNFDRVYSVEIRDDFMQDAKKVFSDFISNDHLRLIHDDSINLEKYILNNEDFDKKTLFFLDAHVENNEYNNIKKCPLFEELSSIKKLNRNDNIILIDDVRILKEMYPWGETSYGAIDFISEIKKIILSINTDYKFDYLDGHIPDDVLIAYIPDYDK